MQRRPASGAEDATRKAGTAAAAIEKQSVAMGCFSGWLGKILNIGHKYQIRQADTFCMF